MKIIFMGTADFAVPALRLLAAEHQVICVYSQPPRPGGRRGQELTLTPVHRAARELGLAVRNPVSLKEPVAQAALAALDADIAVVGAYGLILPRPVLAAPRFGCLNLHASLLPRWRGAAPIQRAILAGDTHSGVTIMRMEAGLDSGPMLARAETPLGSKTAGELTRELAQLGAGLIGEVLASPSRWPEVPQPQAGVCYAPKLSKAETRIDWKQSAELIERQIRAFAPAPGAWFELAGERYRVLSAAIVRLEMLGREIIGPRPEAGRVLDEHLTIACGEAALRPLLIQRAGRPAMACADLLRGRAIPAGTKLA